MPFHVEVSSTADRVRVLNTDETELRDGVLSPWVVGLPFELEDRTWKPRESRLTILEGPALESADGDCEQSWEAALRAAEDVTRPRLEDAEATTPVQAAAVIESSSLELALKSMRSGSSPQAIPWSTALARLSDGDPDVTAVILVVKPPEGDWPEFSAPGA